MPLYISLLNMTRQGVTTVKGTPARVAGAAKAIEAAGGKMLGNYATMGQYDAVVIMEFPTDEAAIGVLLALGATGSARSTTLRAFTAEEFTEILKNVP